MIDAMKASLREAARETRSRLERVEAAAARLPAGDEREALVDGLRALRETVDGLAGAEHDERHQFGHDLRVPLNAIAGWTHILRLDATSPSTVERAVDVFDRNVRALTRLIETYTSEGG